ncbi:hypothetical protein AB0M54_23850 [Actinoplanes sp. NPDC051470]
MDPLHLLASVPGVSGGTPVFVVAGAQLTDGKPIESLSFRKGERLMAVGR